MNPRLPHAFAVGLLLLASATLGHAQAPPGRPPNGFGGPGGPGGPGGFGGPGGLGLIVAEAVQEDLGLTDKQKTQLKRAEATAGQTMRQAFEPKEGGFDPEMVGQAMETARREQDAAVSKILDKTQKARLAQLELQREGLPAIGRKDVAAKLKLTMAQTKKIQAILDELRRAQATAMPRFPGGGGGFPGGNGNANGEGDAPPGGGGSPGGGPPGFDNEEFRGKFAKLMEDQEKVRKTAGDKLAEILTADQKTAFDKLLGNPFDFTKIKPPGKPGGRRPGGPAEKKAEG